MGHSFVRAVLGGVSCLSLAAACSDGAVVRQQPNLSNSAGDSSVGTSGKTGQAGSTGTSGNGGSSSTEGGADMGPGGASGVPAGKGVGDACTDAEPCRDGLTCNAKAVCEPSGDKAPGDACVISAECKDGQCVARQCVPAGEGAEGGGCLSDADCGAGLRCAIVGLGLACTPAGTGDVGGNCASALDCFGGLTCLQDKCAAPPPGVPPLGQPWTGVTCEKPVDNDVKAYFEVPGAPGAEEADFFRLPFPTDARRGKNGLDLTGFPTPGTALLGVDPVQLYVDAITANDSGWGAYPTITFRFSGPLDFGTVATNHTDLVDVTSPADYGTVGWRRFFTDARTNYICDNFMALQPPVGAPLKPGHTYAAFVLSEADGLTLAGRADKKPVTAGSNMGAVLGAAAPTDAKLKAAYTAFAPLRAYLTAKNMPVANVLTASVFTVGEIQAPMTAVADAVAAAPVPTASKWVKCGGAAVSPCPQADAATGRACGADVAGYDEYEALLKLPVFQQGTAPYLTAADGGGIDVKKPHDEDVCMSITVPKGAPPAAGWPAVVFAHGTGGSYRDHVRPEVAGVLAAAAPKFAVIGIDQVEHGPRRGTSMQSPDNLFFNFLNPDVARGNPLQGAADQLSVARFAKALNVDAATSTGSAIKIDGSKLFFFGHSQGSTEGSLMLPFGDDYKAAVLSGNGASLKDALRSKTKPQNIAAALPLVLQDPAMTNATIGAGVTQFHPVLSLLQQWIDPADPLNFAAAVGRPLTGHTGKHLFQTFGLDDSYAPPVTLATYTLAAGLKQVVPDKSAAAPWYDENPKCMADNSCILKLSTAAGYAAANGAFTLGMREYGAPKNSDGHFVVFDTKAANDDMVLFFTGAAGATPPAIGK